MAGFHVLRAASAAEALRIGLTHSQPIPLMVCDVLMPGQSGPRMADEFTGFHPETRFLFMAGLPDHPEVREGIVRRGRAFIPKPFLPRELVARVREMTGGAAPLKAMAAGQ